MLNVKQILDEGLLNLECSHGKPAQVGYDLSIASVDTVGDTFYKMEQDQGRKQSTFIKRVGKILKDKTELVTYYPVPIQRVDEYNGWILHPGTYNITFNEGCKIPNNRVGFIKQRSSLYRNGAVINSPVFDPGFETELMGTIMIVTNVIFIEEKARVAQMYFYECEPAEKYDGQFQNDKWRK